MINQKQNQKNLIGWYELNGKLFHVVEGLQFNGERHILIFSEEANIDYFKLLLGGYSQEVEAARWYQGFVSIRTENEIYLNPKLSQGKKNAKK